MSLSLTSYSQKSTSAIFSAIKWLIITEVKIIALLALIALMIWAIWSYVSGAIFDGQVRRYIPTNIQVGETRAIEGSLTCGVATYDVIDFNPGQLNLRGNGFTDFVTGQVFFDLVGDVANSQTIGSVVYYARDCLDSSKTEEQMMETLSTPDAYFAYHPNGGTVFAYRPETRLLYVIKGGDDLPQF